MIARVQISTKGANESRPAGLQDEVRHEMPYTQPVTLPGSPHDFHDGGSNQEEDDNQDLHDQDMDYMPGDSDSEDDTWDRGSVVAEVCSRWGWTLEDVLETPEQPSLEGRRTTRCESGGPSHTI
jgi:hypothetical protein